MFSDFVSIRGLLGGVPAILYHTLMGRIQHERGLQMAQKKGKSEAEAEVRRVRGEKRTDLGEQAGGEEV
jgi:hypothetical protein